MGLLQKIREAWANHDKAFEEEASPRSRDELEVNRDNTGVGGTAYGGMYGPMFEPPDHGRDE